MDIFENLPLKTELIIISVVGSLVLTITVTVAYFVLCRKTPKKTVDKQISHESKKELSLPGVVLPTGAFQTKPKDECFFIPRIQMVNEKTFEAVRIKPSRMPTFYYRTESPRPEPRFANHFTTLANIES